MQILVKNKKALEQFKGSEPYILIEFVATKTEPADVQDDPNRLSHVILVVDDIDRPVEGLNLFNEEDVAYIIDAIANREKSVNMIVCKCDAGRSRSAGAAAALDRFFNNDDRFTANPKYNPNIHILTVLYKALLKL